MHGAKWADKCIYRAAKITNKRAVTSIRQQQPNCSGAFAVKSFVILLWYGESDNSKKSNKYVIIKWNLF